jgi:hypothetical protein
MLRDLYGVKQGDANYNEVQDVINEFLNAIVAAVRREYDRLFPQGRTTDAAMTVDEFLRQSNRLQLFLQMSPDVRLAFLNGIKDIEKTSQKNSYTSSVDKNRVDTFKKMLGLMTVEQFLYTGERLWVPIFGMLDMEQKQRLLYFLAYALKTDNYYEKALQARELIFKEMPEAKSIEPQLDPISTQIAKTIVRHYLDQAKQRPDDKDLARFLSQKDNGELSGLRRNLLISIHKKELSDDERNQANRIGRAINQKLKEAGFDRTDSAMAALKWEQFLAIHDVKEQLRVFLELKFGDQEQVLKGMHASKARHEPSGMLHKHVEIIQKMLGAMSFEDFLNRLDQRLWVLVFQIMRDTDKARILWELEHASKQAEPARKTIRQVIPTIGVIVLSQNQVREPVYIYIAKFYARMFLSADEGSWLNTFKNKKTTDLVALRNYIKAFPGIMARANEGERRVNQPLIEKAPRAIEKITQILRARGYSDKAALAKSEEDLGGINFDSGMLSMTIKRDGKGMPLPVNQQPETLINLSGLTPVIINIQESVNVAQMLGLAGANQNTNSKEPLFIVNQR